MWGPVAVSPATTDDHFFFSLIGSSDAKIYGEIIQKDGHLLVYPTEALKDGKIYQLYSEGKSKPVINSITIHKACIVYMVRTDQSSAIWKKCSDVEPIRLSQPDEAVEDYTISRSGELIFYTKINNRGGNEIWQVNGDGTKNEIVHDCTPAVCSGMSLDAYASKLVFHQQNNTQQIGLLDLRTGDVSFIEGSGSEASLSPDGSYLCLLDDVTGKLSVINFENENQIIVQSEIGLMGEWARDSHSILYGEIDFWGGIPGVKVNELEIPSGEIKTILYDETQSFEFYQPRYTLENGIFLAAVRSRGSGASRQLWLLGEGVEGIRQITSDPQFHYSFPSWNPDYSELVFQRFPISQSEGYPQVVVWNRDSDSFHVIAENASKPLWLP